MWERFLLLEPDFADNTSAAAAPAPYESNWWRRGGCLGFFVHFFSLSMNHLELLVMSRASLSILNHCKPQADLLILRYILKSLWTILNHSEIRIPYQPIRTIIFELSWILNGISLSKSWTSLNYMLKHSLNSLNRREPCWTSWTILKPFWTFKASNYPVPSSSLNLPHFWKEIEISAGRIPRGAEY